MTGFHISIAPPQLEELSCDKRYGCKRLKHLYGHHCSESKVDLNRFPEAP